MKKSDDRARILIAVTETSPVTELWQAALEQLDRDAELVALFVSDDRWHRAASLPFTREISRLGAVADFTRQRADQLYKESVARIRKSIAELAEQSDVAPEFEELSDRNAARLEELAAGARSVLIASSLITREPIYTFISSLDCRIELIDSPASEHVHPARDDQGKDSDMRR